MYHGIHVVSIGRRVYTEPQRHASLLAGRDWTVAPGSPTAAEADRTALLTGYSSHVDGRLQQCPTLQYPCVPRLIRGCPEAALGFRSEENKKLLRTDLRSGSFEEEPRGGRRLKATSERATQICMNQNVAGWTWHVIGGSTLCRVGKGGTSANRASCSWHDNTCKNETSFYSVWDLL